ncbi:hypothetical protein HMI54_009424 [Coelomomyces lativittatus]|nr:hypothetical protein HMI54_009424 [Coelomomyces lativittatus]
MLALDDGTNTQYSSRVPAGTKGPLVYQRLLTFGTHQASALFSTGPVRSGPYSHGCLPGAGNFGLITVSQINSDEIT